jgi:hypothetical protein
MKIFRLILPIMVPALSLVYACGDFYGWWDQLRGRSNAIEGVQALSSPNGFPDIIIYSDESGFKELFALITHKTENKKVIELNKDGKVPTAIFRAGGTLQPDVGKLPSNWPNPKFAPTSSPVAVAYGWSRSEASIDGNKVEPVGQLGDLSEWINESRNRERFIVSSILIGLLSIAVVILDITRAKSQ